MNDLVTSSDEKREQIFQAAVAEFLEKGFSSASMDRISARAGASKRTVYKYFDNKEKLFQELMRRHWKKFGAGIQIRYETGRPIRDQLLELGHAEGELLSSHDVMAMTRLVMSEILRSPELVEENQEKTEYKTVFENMFQAAADDGQLRIETPSEAADEFIVLLKGKAFWPVVFGAPVVTPEEMTKIVEGSVEIMMRRYGV